MGKPSAKFLIVFNLVTNIPTAIAMTTTGMLVGGQGDQIFKPGWFIGILIGFICACIINLVIPIQKISAWFAGLFHQDTKSFAGNLIGAVPASFIFVVIIGLVMNLINIAPKAGVGAAIGALIGTFIPMWIVCWIVASIFVPIAIGAALKADGKA